MSPDVGITVIVLACCVTVIAVVACFLVLWAMRRSIARERSLQAGLIRQTEALQQAERKSLNKTAAFAGASHDIRSALAAITGLVDLSRIEAQKHLQMMHNLEQMDLCTKKLFGILNSILDTSKIESGKMQLEEVEFNMANALEEPMAMINIVGISTGLEVVWDPCDLSVLQCGNVIGDCRRLKQILDNILGNSVKFTQKGHVVLRAWANKPIASSLSVPSRFSFPSPACNFVRCFKTREYHAHHPSFSSVQNDPSIVEFYFEVDDSGIGIPKEKRELVFENYVQVNEGQGGTGLGLGIVQSFVRLMRGEIAIKDREPGETGTCIGFNVFMKMSVVKEEHDIEEARSIPSSIERSESHIRASAFSEASNFEGGHCVLLVHGDETPRILRAWLENLGLKIWLVSEAGLLASTLEKICHGNASIARISSASFECSTDQCFKPSDAVNQILPAALKDSGLKRGIFGGHSFGVLVVIDAHYGEAEEICTEKIFAEIKNEIPCKTYYLDYKKAPPTLGGFRHCDLVLQKPIHGSRLYTLLRTLKDIQISHVQHPSRVNTENAGASNPGSSGSPTLAMVASLAEKSEVEEDKPLTGTHVLLVEDTSILQSIGKRILYKLGATVEAAENGAEAVRMFKATLEHRSNSERMEARSTSYDVIFMDCQMPMMDGYEATRCIREVESSYSVHTPIIALTAQAMEEERQKAILARMDLHLTKPMEQKSIEAIRRVCRGGANNDGTPFEINQANTNQ